MIARPHRRPDTNVRLPFPALRSHLVRLAPNIFQFDTSLSGAYFRHLLVYSVGWSFNPGLCATLSSTERTAIFDVRGR